MPAQTNKILLDNVYVLLSFSVPRNLTFAIEILLRFFAIKESFPREGLEMAYPTQTIFLNKS